MNNGVLTGKKAMQPQAMRWFDKRSAPDSIVRRGFPMISTRAVEEESDSDPRLSRIMLLTMLVGSTAIWAAIGLLLARLLF